MPEDTNTPTPKPRYKVQAKGVRHVTRDSFANFQANLGIGANNLTSASSYGFNPITRVRLLLEFLYRGSWLGRKIVDCPAKDMTRAGIDIESTIPPDQAKAIMTAWKRFQLWERLRDTVKWARLYGGALAVISIDGQDMSTPLNMSTIAKDSFKGLIVLDRWQVQPDYTVTVQDLGPDFGKPIYYTTVGSTELATMKVHHSRVIRMEGDDLPYWQRVAENGWGASVIEAMYDRMVAFDSATTGAAQLVYKAHLRVYSVPGLREMIAGGGEMLVALLDQLRNIRLYQSTEGLTLIDGGDKMEFHNTTAFSGLSDALAQFGQQLSGACGIPLVILFGQSPSGFSTGDTDVLNYYDRISSEQTEKLEEPVRRLLNILHWSMFGRAPETGFDFSFNSLWQQTDQQKADTAGKVTTAVTTAYSSNLISQQTGLKELKQSSRETGIFSNISEKEIAEADDSPPSPEEAGAMPGQMGDPGVSDPGDEPPGAPDGGQPEKPKGTSTKPVFPSKKPRLPANMQEPGDTETDDDGMAVVRGTGKPVIRISPKLLARVKINRNR